MGWEAKLTVLTTRRPAASFGEPGSPGRTWRRATRHHRLGAGDTAGVGRMEFRERRKREIQIYLKKIKIENSPLKGEARGGEQRPPALLWPWRLQLPSLLLLELLLLLLLLKRPLQPIRAEGRQRRRSLPTFRGAGPA